MPRHAVQTPGEATQAPEPEKTELQAVVVQTGLDGDDQASEPTEIDRLRSMVEAQSAQIANLMGAVQNMARSAHGNGEKPGQSDGGLPDAHSVDQASLTAPVLTKQGWLVPADYGMPPEAKEEREERAMLRAQFKASMGKTAKA